jgi:hypothetical protein
VGRNQIKTFSDQSPLSKAKELNLGLIKSVYDHNEGLNAVSNTLKRSMEVGLVGCWELTRQWFGI